MWSVQEEGSLTAPGAEEPLAARDGAPNVETAAAYQADENAMQPERQQQKQQPEEEEEEDVLMLPAFQTGDMVVCPNPRRARLLWPGVIVDPREAPDEVRRGMKAACHCVMLLGPSGSGKSPLRDFSWAPDSAMRHIDEGLPPLPTLPRGSSKKRRQKKNKKKPKPKKKAAAAAASKRVSEAAAAAEAEVEEGSDDDDDDDEGDDSLEESVDALRSAIEEALALEAGTADATPAEALSLAREAAAALARSKGAFFEGPPCSSCGSCLTEAEVRAFKATTGPSSQASAAAVMAAAAAAAAASNNNNTATNDGDSYSPATESTTTTITPAALLFLRHAGPRGPAPGRCDTCQRLASEGHFCPCCQAAWHAGDRDMVCCDSCLLWVHFRCDPREAPKAAQEGEKCHYSCPACRKAAGAAGLVSELAAAEAALRASAPRRARSAYNLFSVEAHKGVGAAALAAGGDFRDALRAVAEAWRSLPAGSKEPFEAAARVEAERAAREREAFRALQARYLAARTAAAAAGVIDAEGKPVGEAAAAEAVEAAVELRKKQLEEAAAAAAKKRKTASAGGAGAGAEKKKKTKEGKAKAAARASSSSPTPPPPPSLDIHGGGMASSIPTPAADSLGCLLPALTVDEGGDRDGEGDDGAGTACGGGANAGAAAAAAAAPAAAAAAAASAAAPPPPSPPEEGDILLPALLSEDEDAHGHGHGHGHGDGGVGGTGIDVGLGVVDIGSVDEAAHLQGEDDGDALAEELSLMPPPAGAEAAAAAAAAPPAVVLPSLSLSEGRSNQNNSDGGGDEDEGGDNAAVLAVDDGLTEVPVVCAKSGRGVFRVATMRVTCLCEGCSALRRGEPVPATFAPAVVVQPMLRPPRPPPPPPPPPPAAAAATTSAAASLENGQADAATAAVAEATASPPVLPPPPPPQATDFSTTAFEAHCGSGAAKKWKATVKIPRGGAPEVPLDAAQSMPIGKWLELRGLDVPRSHRRGGGGEGGGGGSDAGGAGGEKPAKRRKGKGEKGKASLAAAGRGDSIGSAAASAAAAAAALPPLELSLLDGIVVLGEGGGAVPDAAAPFAAAAAPASNSNNATATARNAPKPIESFLPRGAVERGMKAAADALAAANAAARAAAVAATSPVAVAASAAVAAPLPKKKNASKKKEGGERGENGDGKTLSFPDAASAVAAAAAAVEAAAATAPWLRHLDPSAEASGPLPAHWAGDRCAVCDLDVDYDFDQIVSCGGCHVAVHQSCYGVSVVPGPGEAPWVCRACEVLGNVAAGDAARAAESAATAAKAQEEEAAAASAAAEQRTDDQLLLLLPPTTTTTTSASQLPPPAALPLPLRVLLPLPAPVRPRPRCCLCPVAGGALKPAEVSVPDAVARKLETALLAVAAERARGGRRGETTALDAAEEHDAAGAAAAAAAAAPPPLPLVIPAPAPTPATKTIWAHVACVQWLPELSIPDSARMEPIKGIQYVKRERWEQQCCVCRRGGGSGAGAGIKCRECRTWFHPLCGRTAGLHFEANDSAHNAAGLVFVGSGGGGAAGPSAVGAGAGGAAGPGERSAAAAAATAAAAAADSAPIELVCLCARHGPPYRRAQQEKSEGGGGGDSMCAPWEEVGVAGLTVPALVGWEPSDDEGEEGSDCGCGKEGEENVEAVAPQLPPSDAAAAAAAAVAAAPGAVSEPATADDDDEDDEKPAPAVSGEQPLHAPSELRAPSEPAADAGAPAAAATAPPTPQQPRSGGNGPYSSDASLLLSRLDQEKFGDDGSGLWNGQPYPRPARAPRPRAPAGAARLTPLLMSGSGGSGGNGKGVATAAPAGCCSVPLSRVSHGTGVGCTSAAGYWIPLSPPPTLEELSEAEDEGDGDEKGGAAGKNEGEEAGADTNGDGAGDAAAEEEDEGVTAADDDDDGGGDSEEAKASAAAAKAAEEEAAAAAAEEVAAAERAAAARDRAEAGARSRTARKLARAERRERLLRGPPRAELLPMPAGLPEALPIFCGGRKGALSLRTLRVSAPWCGTVSGSRFESLCGKGETKKWRSSLKVAEELGGDHAADAAAAASANGGGGGENGGKPSPGPQEPRSVAEWLAAHAISRDMLSRLVSNADAAAAWQDHLKRSVRSVVRGLLARVLAGAEGEGGGGEGGAGGEGEATTPGGLTRRQRRRRLRAELRLADDDDSEDEYRDLDSDPEGGSENERGGEDSGDDADADDEINAAAEAAAAAAAAARQRREAPAAKAERDRERDIQRRRALARANAEALLAATDPLALGDRVRVFWPADGDWYEGVVTALQEDPADEKEEAEARAEAEAEAEAGEAAGRSAENEAERRRVRPPGHRRFPRFGRVWYFADGAREWHDLRLEARFGSLRRVPKGAPAAPSAIEAAHARAAAERAAAAQRAAASAARAAAAEAESRRLGEAALAKAKAFAGRALAGDAAVGCRVGIWWDGDFCFYYAAVEGHDEASGRHLVVYEDDGVREWLPLSGEGAVTVDWSGAPPAVTKEEGGEEEGEEEEEEEEAKAAEEKAAAAAPAAAAAAAPAAAAAAAAAAAPKGEPETSGANEEAEPAPAAPAAPVSTAAGAAARSSSPSPAPAPPATAPPAPAPPAPAPPPPKTVTVVCGHLRGEFDIASTSVLLPGGRTVSGTEFERLGGRGVCKKWKTSLRVLDEAAGDGVTPGRSLGDWLISRGLDREGGGGAGAGGGGGRNASAAAAAAAASAFSSSNSTTLALSAKQLQLRAASPSLCDYFAVANRRTLPGRAAAGHLHRGNFLNPDGTLIDGVDASELAKARFLSAEDERARRRRAAHTAAAATGDAPMLPAGHRPGCGCAVCKQIRRSLRLWHAAAAGAEVDAFEEEGEEEGAGGGGEAAAAEEAPQEGTKEGGEGRDLGANGNSKRRARSATPLPSSKKPRVLSGKRSYLEAVPHVVSSGPRRTPARLLPEGTAVKVKVRGAADAKIEAATTTALAPPLLTSGALPAAAAAASLPAAGENFPSAAAAAAAAAKAAAPAATTATAGIVSETMATRLAAARRLEPAAVAFGKSGVAGWGAFARRRFEAGAIVMDYRGEEIRAGAIATAREESYRAAGDDCYLFARDSKTLVDTTRRGCVARFTNHSCVPSLYTRVLPADEKSGSGAHIVFLARTEIKPGQELTYDYRFAEEEGEAKVGCACGAPTCRGTLN